MPTPPVRRKVSDFPLRIDTTALGSIDNIDDDSDDESEFQLDGSLISTPLSTSSNGIKNSIETYNLKKQKDSNATTATATTINGMTLCLENLHRILGILQRRCDKELTARLQQKNEYTIAVITDLYEYRKRLLTHISDSPEVSSSSLNSTYVNLFHGVPITLPPKPSEVPIVRNIFSAFMKKDDTKANEPKTPTTASTTTDSDGNDNLIPMDDYTDDGNCTNDKNTTPKSISSLTKWLFNTKSDETPDATTTTTPKINTNSTEKRPSFVPSIGRLPTSAKLVKERLEAYRKFVDRNDIEGKETIERNTDNSIVVTEANKELPTQPRDVVLFYCACLISGTPGTLYLTPYLVCFAYGVLGITSSKEAYPLSKLDSVTAPEKNTVLTSNTLKLQFYNGSICISIAPVVMECQRLRAILLDAKDCYDHLSLPLNFNLE